MIWGGDKLCQYKTIDTDQKNIGESWELSRVPGNESVVSNGEFAVGPSLSWSSTAFPLTLKVILGFTISFTLSSWFTGILTRSQNTVVADRNIFVSSPAWEYDFYFRTTILPGY